MAETSYPSQNNETGNSEPAGNSPKTHMFPDENTIPLGNEHEAGKEQDSDELVHDQSGSLPDSEELSLEEDDEYDRGKIANK